MSEDAVAPTTETLGYANPFAPEGVNVTILSPRVMAAANEQGIENGTLLAHSIAHEICHVLLRSSSHGEQGLMAGPWSADHFLQIRRTGMFFEEADAKRMKGEFGR